MATPFKACAVEGCNGNAHLTARGVRGWCSKHYQKWAKYGDPTVSFRSHDLAMDFISQIAVVFEGDGCLAWPYSCNSNGYGRFWEDGKEVPAARYVCEVVNGPPPSPEHETAHSCGKGHEGCVNPNHLRWATHQENMQDAIVHGTARRGGRAKNSKFSPADIERIRLLSKSVSQREIARRYDVAHRTIQRIVKGEQWAWL